MEDQIQARFEDEDIGRLLYRIMKTWHEYQVARLNAQTNEEGTADGMYKKVEAISRAALDHDKAIREMVAYMEQQGVPVTATLPLFKEQN